MVGKQKTTNVSHGRKGKKNTPKTKSYQKPKMEGFEMEKSKYNDPSWYIREGQLAKDVASFSFNNALGARQYVGSDNPNGTWSSVALPYGLPGIMAIHTVPALGISNSSASPLNIAAKNLYSFVRHQNSGSKNYDSPDLMLYVLAMDSIYSAIIHLQRAYAAALVTSQVNRYVGDAMLTAMGFNPGDVRSTLADFRARINMLIVKASAFCVPNTMTLFRRHAWMYSTVFRDSDLKKSSFYLYRPIGLFSYDESGGNPGSLKLTLLAASQASGTEYVSTTTWNTAIWISTIESMMSKLVQSEDINIMSGDILKAYGSENLFKLDLVPENASIEFAYSEEILDQIHNTDFIGRNWRNVLDITDPSEVSTFSTDSFNVYQDPNIGPGSLHFVPQVMNARNLGVTKILDMYDEDPTPERVLVATRNKVTATVDLATDSSSTPTTIATLDSAGSDLCAFATIYDYHVDLNGVWTLRWTTAFPQSGTIANVISNMDDYMAFHRAPIAYGFFNGTTGDLTGIYGEIDNFTAIDSSNISKMHESAILSMLGVPV